MHKCFDLLLAKYSQLESAKLTFIHNFNPNLDAGLAGNRLTVL